MTITKDVISSGIIEKIKLIYEQKSMILCSDGNKYPLKQNNNKIVIFPFDDDENIIHDFWNVIAEMEINKKIPVWENYCDWLKVVGKDYQMTINDLIESIEKQKSLSELKLKNNSNNAQAKWIDSVLDILNKKHKLQEVAVTHSIIPNQKNNLLKASGLVYDNNIDEKLKDILTLLGEDIKQKLLHQCISHKFDSLESYDNKIIANKIKTHVFEQLSEENRLQRKREPKISTAFNDLLLWFSENTSTAKELFGELYSDNKYKLYDEVKIVENIEKAKKYDELNSMLEQYGVKNNDDLKKLISLHKSNDQVYNEFDKQKLTEEILIQLGIDSPEALNRAFNNSVFLENFVHQSSCDAFKFDYVQEILKRARTRILNFLKGKSEYNLDKMIEIDKTIYLVSKNDEEIYIIIRPSDYEQVIIYYDTELDVLDYEKDWELWVENGKEDPRKISFGKILKITGINKIPLKRIW